ncbi:MAG: DUF2892 domain-containing protein [Sphingomicrobium sp.]
MVKNVGSGDRVIRLVVGCGLAFLAFTPAVDGTAAIIVYAIAAYLAVSALLGFCLFYKMLDVDTCHDHGGTYHSGEDPFDGRGGD